MKKNEEKEADCLDDTPPIDKQEGVNDRKSDKNEKKVEGKEAEFPDDTPPVDTEEGVSGRKYDKNEKLMKEKRQTPEMTLPLLIWRKV